MVNTLVASLDAMPLVMIFGVLMGSFTGFLVATVGIPSFAATRSIS